MPQAQRARFFRFTLGTSAGHHPGEIGLSFRNNGMNKTRPFANGTIFVSGERPARLSVESNDHIWSWLYQAPWTAVETAAINMNFLQFLTIRRYLTLMFSALIILLLLITVWV